MSHLASPTSIEAAIERSPVTINYSMIKTINKSVNSVKTLSRFSFKDQYLKTYLEVNSDITIIIFYLFTN